MNLNPEENDEASELGQGNSGIQKTLPANLHVIHRTKPRLRSQIFRFLSEKRKRRKIRRKKAIVEIVSILLLITVAIAAVTIVYAYVIGFIGTVATNTIAPLSIISIDNACVSSQGKCISPSSSGTFFVVVRNLGSLSIAITESSEPQVYLTDTTLGVSFTTSCNSPPMVVSQGQTFVCSCPGFCNFAPAEGDIVTVKVVVPDGGLTQINVKVI